MTIKEQIKKARSIRGFDRSRPVSPEELLDLIDCARLCPSARNQQALCFYPAWEEEEVTKIQQLTRWAGALPTLTIPHNGMEPTAFVIICLNKEVTDNAKGVQKDVGIAAEAMLLAAGEKELGGCMIGSFQREALCECLSLEDRYEPLLLLALGKPMETVVLTEMEPGDSVDYYRDEQDIHYVPKRKLQDIVIPHKK